MTQIARLGYPGFEVSGLALPEWERFALQVLGLAVADHGADGSLPFRMDEQAWRIRLQPGERDDLAYVGFEVEDEATLRALAERLAAAGVAVDEAKPELCAARRVERLVQLADPNGVPIELFCGSARAAEPFRSELVPSGFDVEVGWGGRKVDDATWEPTTYDCKSIWGHRSPPAG